MKYHVHRGPYGSRGEAPSIEYRDDRNRTIASYSLSAASPAFPATDWITLYSAPNVPHPKQLPHVDGQAQAICIAHLLSLGFTEHESSKDTFDHRSMCD